MKLPVYSSQESPITPLRVPQGALLPENEGQGVAVALEKAGGVIETIAQHQIAAERVLEETRVNVQKAKFFMGMDDAAATARENPDLALTPEQNQQGFIQKSTEAVQGFAGTIRDERNRNHFLAEALHRTEAHSLQIRHAAGVAWHDENRASAFEVATANLQRYQATGDPGMRAQIQADQFAQYDALVASRHMYAKAAEIEKKKWLRGAEMGAAEWDGRARPEEAIRDLFLADVTEQGDTVFRHYPSLTYQERSAVERNIRIVQNVRDKNIREDKRDADERFAVETGLDILDGKYGESNTIDRAKINGLLRGRSQFVFDHVESVVESHARRTTRADTKESKALGASYQRKIIGASEDTIKELMFAAQTDEGLSEGDLKEITRAGTWWMEHNTTKANQAIDRLERLGRLAEAQKLRKDAAALKSSVLEADSWMPSGKGILGKLLAGHVNEGWNTVRRVVENAITIGQDPVQAVKDRRADIIMQIYQGAETARKARLALIPPQHTNVSVTRHANIPEIERKRLLELWDEIETLYRYAKEEGGGVVQKTPSSKQAPTPPKAQ